MRCADGDASAAALVGSGGVFRQATATSKTSGGRRRFIVGLVYPRKVPAWKILVVDDDPDIRRVAALALERIGGFGVLLAASAAEALAVTAVETPDLILLDVTMPDVDGPTLLGALRTRPATERVPVVFFTATSSDAEVERLCSLGAVAVIAKPFEIADLPRRVRDILAGAGVHSSG
jgi:CheY-like chemotaxis protein